MNPILWQYIEVIFLEWNGVKAGHNCTMNSLTALSKSEDNWNIAY